VNRVDIIESLERRVLFNALAFSQPTSFDAGTNPSDLVTADLTGSNVTDVITSDFSSASIAVLIGNGNGTFQPPVTYPVGNSPESLAVGDFNHDGIPDIVTANDGDNTISVLIGKGDGTFAPAVSYSVGIRPQAIAVADLNGDGFPDIVTADEGSNEVSVLLNEGNGNFAPAVSYQAGIAPVAIALGDLANNGHTDIVVANPFTNSVHVLLNDGTGVFSVVGAFGTALSPRSIALTDVNSDGHLDIITGDLNSEAISVLLGNGNGLFQPTHNYIIGVRPISLVLADVNGDGRPDVITADNFDNGVGIRAETGIGGFAPTRSFNAGNGPVAAVAADINGDGRPDLLVADFNNDTISVLLNQTVFVPLVPTAVTLTPSQSTVEAGNRLVLTAQVTKAAISPYTPAGVVQFYVGQAVIGVALVSPSGLARIVNSSLAVGDYPITAHYLAVSIFAGSITSTIVETVVPAAQATPFVEPTINALHIPNNYVPGVLAIADVAIYDQGAGPARGTVAVQMFVSTSTTFDSTAIPVTQRGSSNVDLNLLGNQTREVPVSFYMPADIQPGNYTVFAALVPVSGLNSTQVSAVPAVGLNNQQAVLQFGAVSTQKGYNLTRTLANGDTYTAELHGHGYGAVTENADGGITITLYNTSGNTNVTILSSTGVTLDGLTDAGQISVLYAPTTNVDGPVNLGVGVRRVTLANVSNTDLTFGGGTPSVLSLGNLSNVFLQSYVGIESLTLGSFTNQPNDLLTAAWIDTLQCTGDFGPNLLTYTTFGGFRRSLDTVNIGGAVGNALWRIIGNAGTINVGAVAAGWSGSIGGSLQSFVDQGDFDGQLAAHSVGLMQINGNVNNADILAGADFGNGGRLVANAGTFGSGILSSLVINGSVVNSIIAAGLKPSGTNLLPPAATLLPRSAVKSIKVAGTVDATSLFLAVSLPPFADVAGSEIPTSGNVNFLE
jgi:hypothetical protein